jgi:hypothetical protein
MPRSMSVAMLAALQAKQLLPAIFVSIGFSSGTVYMWNGLGSITWNGHTWTGVGSFGGISAVQEGATIEASGITLSLSGIDNALLADVNQNLQLGLPVAVYLGLFDVASPTSLLPDPLVAWTGAVDQPTVEVDGATATISINCEHRLVDMNVAVDRRYTHDDAQIDHPGDLGFQFVNSLQEVTLYWGRVPNGQNYL